MPKCRSCGGWGKGLVLQSSYCRHCTRILNLNHNPSECEYCLDGFYDISPSFDGGVHKKITRAGTNSSFPVEGCPTRIQYVGRLLDMTIFDTTRDLVDGRFAGGTDDPHQFILQRNEAVVKGWDIGVSTMTVGEVSRFVLSERYAFGASGFEPKVFSFSLPLSRLRTLSLFICLFCLFKAPVVASVGGTWGDGDI
jgi:hypothetical protein